MVTGQGRDDGAGPCSSQEVMSGSSLVTLTRVSHGPVMADRPGEVAELEAKLGVSLGIKAEAGHRQSWGCSWGCNGAQPMAQPALKCSSQGKEGSPSLRPVALCLHNTFL